MQNLEQKMQEELNTAVEECIREVNGFILPLERKSEEGVSYIKVITLLELSSEHHFRKDFCCLN